MAQCFEEKAKCFEVQHCKAARGGTAQRCKAQSSGVGKFGMLLLSACTLSPAGVSTGGTCSYHPMSAQGHEELECKAPPHDGSFTSIPTDHLAANGTKGASISSPSPQQPSHTRGGKHILSAKRGHLLNYKRGDTIDNSWEKLKATMVQVQSVPEYPPSVSTTSCFPTCESVLHPLRVHHKMCYNQCDWEGLECNHILPPYVVQGHHRVVKSKSIPTTTLYNFTTLWNNAMGNYPLPQMTMLDLNCGKLELLQCHALHAWNLNSISLDQAKELDIPVNVNPMARNRISALMVTNLLELCEVFEDDARNDLHTRSSESLELFAPIGGMPFKDYLQLQLFKNTEYGHAEFPPNIHHAGHGRWSFESFETTFMFKYSLWVRQWDKFALNGDGNAQLCVLNTTRTPIWLQVLADVIMTQLWSTQGTMPASLEPMRTTPWGLMIGRACVIVGIQETAMCADNEALKRDQDKGTRQMPQRSSKWEFNKLWATLSNPEHMLRYCAFEAATNRVPQLNRCHLKITRDSRVTNLGLSAFKGLPYKIRASVSNPKNVLEMCVFYATTNIGQQPNSRQG